MEYVELLYHVDEAEHAGNQLGDHSRPACAHDAHIQYDYHEQVKTDVQHAGDEQEVQRRL